MSGQQDLINFAFEDELCRVVVREGEPWFVATDVCRVLGVEQASRAVEPLDDDEKAAVSLTHTSSNGVKQLRDVLIVSESGLYTLVVRSRAATTPGTVQHRFRKWVFGEVLPEIRRTGSYAGAANEDWDWEALGLKLQMVKEARLQHGRKVSSALWVKLGLPMPDTAEPVREAPTQGVHFVQNFLDDCVVEEGFGRVQASELKRAYDQWADRSSAPPMTATAFGRTLGALGLSKVSSQHVFYTGIRLKHLTELLS